MSSRNKSCERYYCFVDNSRQITHNVLQNEQTNRIQYTSSYPNIYNDNENDRKYLQQEMIDGTGERIIEPIGAQMCVPSNHTCKANFEHVDVANANNMVCETNQFAVESSEADEKYKQRTLNTNLYKEQAFENEHKYEHNPLETQVYERNVYELPRYYKVEQLSCEPIVKMSKLPLSSSSSSSLSSTELRRSALALSELSFNVNEIHNTTTDTTVTDATATTAELNCNKLQTVWLPDKAISENDDKNKELLRTVDANLRQPQPQEMTESLTVGSSVVDANRISNANEINDYYTNKFTNKSTTEKEENGNATCKNIECETDTIVKSETACIIDELHKKLSKEEIEIPTKAISSTTCNENKNNSNSNAVKESKQSSFNLQECNKVDNEHLFRQLHDEWQEGRNSNWLKTTPALSLHRESISARSFHFTQESPPLTPNDHIADRKNLLPDEASGKMQAVFVGPGPTPMNDWSVLHKCFKKGNGLLFRLEDHIHHIWAFYNDTQDYIMKVEATFGHESMIQPLGNTKQVIHDVNSGHCTLYAEIGTFETVLFMRGEFNGFSLHYDAIPIYRFKEQKVNNSSVNYEHQQHFALRDAV